MNWTSVSHFVVILWMLTIFTLPTAIAECKQRLKDLSESNVSASSYKTSYEPYKADLNSDGSWSPAESAVGEWLLVDLGKVMLLTGTGLRAPGGSTNDSKAVVTSYDVFYSLDNVSFSLVVRATCLKKLFTGVSIDTKTVPDTTFNSTFKPVLVRFIKVFPQTWVGEIALRIGFYGCSSGLVPLGMSEGKLLNDDQITASSELNSFHRAASARPHVKNFWCSAINDLKQFLQIDFVDTVLLTGVKVTGVTYHGHGTKSFILFYKEAVEETWKSYPGVNGSMVFNTSPHKEQSVLITLVKFVVARQVRINPQSWISRLCLKAEFYGIYEKEMLDCDKSSKVCTWPGVCKILTPEAPDFKYCVCESGFLGDGVRCIDYDECEYSDQPCGSHEFCLNERGSFMCLCEKGYNRMRNGSFCEDIDECLVGNFTCPHNTICVNTEGSYKCKCNPVGFYSVGEKCIDINECQKASNKCHKNAECINSVGSYLCYCADGYTGDGIVSCSDVDECLQSPIVCHSKASCSNTKGSYHCICNRGFTGNGKTCQDIDECEGQTDCDENSLCINYDGSYVCECLTGYKAHLKSSCIDINECQLNVDDCHKFANCFNTPGSYLCVCKQGYYGDGRTCSKTRPAVSCLRPTEGEFCDAVDEDVKQIQP